MKVTGVTYDIPFKNCILIGNIRIVIARDKDLSNYL